MPDKVEDIYERDPDDEQIDIPESAIVDTAIAFALIVCGILLARAIFGF